MPTDTRTGLEVIGVVPEGGSRTYRTVLKDTSQSPPTELTALTTCFLTRYNEQTRRTIGEVRKDVLNANGGTFGVAGTGILDVVLGPSDNRLENQRKREERHILHFDYSYNGGATEDVHEVMIIVRNMVGVGE